MNKRQARRMQSIRNKLMAAICMLLVSSIMMVSTTYAWFTLSTAPEVSGITTAVGANGNLEMALLPEDGLVDSITSESGDGALTDAKLKNVTWGNLVDLDDAYYGMDKITLYPAELNVDGTNMQASMLKTPTYGPDGRVKELTPNTVTGIYKGTAFNQSETNRGVRAVGTASGMTERQLAYRNARSSASSYTERAKTLATQALADHGSKLASIAVKHATNSGATHTQTEVGYLSDMITDLQSADGILAQIDKAYIQYIVAYAASAASGLEDLAFEAIKAAVESKATAQEAIDAIAGIAADNGAAFDLPDTLEAPISALNATRAKVTEAAGKVALLTGEEIAWGAISPVVAALADAEKMQLNGMKIDALMNDKDAAANSILKNGITLQVGTGAGVFADIADHCGDYSTSIVIDEISYGGTTVRDMDANMETKSNLNPNYYLPAVGVVVTGAGSPAGGTTGDKPITDMYGYVIDLAFRTNAADSKLLLQTEAVDRIYGNDGVDETMGHGSTMTFQASTPNFSNDQVKSLMKAVEIVFFDSGTNEILATGSLAADAATLGADGLTAKILLSKVVTEYKLDNENGTYKKTAEGNYVQIGDGETDITEKYKLVMTEELVTTPSEAVIRPLTQNDPTAVSVLVYLDGNKVANEDVANATTSVTGKMNLQFASSATLVPMEYTPLKNQNPKVDFANDKVTVKDEAATVESASFRGKSVTINLTAPEGKVITGVTGVTVGEKTLESGTFTYSDGALKFTYEGLTADTVVEITVTTEAAPTPETPVQPEPPVDPQG